MIEVSYLMKTKIKKIFLEVIFITKILYIILLNEVERIKDFAKLTGGTRQGRAEQRFNTVIVLYFCDK